MIGILSSGLGGLSFVRALERRHAGVSLCYWGDTAAGPWGSRSLARVSERVQEGVNFLDNKNVESIVIASAEASTVIRAGEVNVRVPAVDILECATRTALTVSHKKRFGIIGSRLVIERTGMLGLEQQGGVVVKKATPAFMPLIIEGEEQRGEMRRLLRAELQWFKTQNIDTLIMGSIHYMQVIEEITEKMGKNISVIHPVDELVESLMQQGELHKGAQTFYLTDVTPRDMDMGSKLLGRTVRFEKT